MTADSITITDGLCTSYQGTEIIIQGLPMLKTIVIGDDCFGKVRTLELNGLYELESVSIGQRSFNGFYDGSCRIVNCPKLKSIQIGDGSFYDYQSFELNNLPSLQSIEIGDYCFCYALSSSFSLTGLID